MALEGIFANLKMSSEHVYSPMPIGPPCLSASASRSRRKLCSQNPNPGPWPTRWSRDFSDSFQGPGGVPRVGLVIISSCHHCLRPGHGSPPEWPFGLLQRYSTSSNDKITPEHVEPEVRGRKLFDFSRLTFNANDEGDDWKRVSLWLRYLQPRTLH